jgi:hypothetical protein
MIDHVSGCEFFLFYIIREIDNGIFPVVMRISGIHPVGLSYNFVGIFRAYNENLYPGEIRKITFVS